MKCETGTFELRDNDMMMRELSSAETNEVVGGTGEAQVTSFSASGTGSSLTINGDFRLVTSNTTASASIAETISATGSSNLVQISSVAVVF